MQAVCSGCGFICQTKQKRGCKIRRDCDKGGKCKFVLKRGWGDWVEWWLIRWGFSKWKVKKCGCEERREWLNGWGRKVVKWWKAKSGRGNG